MDVVVVGAAQVCRRERAARARLDAQRCGDGDLVDEPRVRVRGRGGPVHDRGRRGPRGRAVPDLRPAEPGLVLVDPGTHSFPPEIPKGRQHLGDVGCVESGQGTVHSKAEETYCEGPSQCQNADGSHARQWSEVRAQGFFCECLSAR